MMASGSARHRSWSRRSRVAIGMAVVAAAAGASYGVWFLGLDPLWSVATVLAVVPAAAALTTVRFEEDAAWDPPGQESPRGVRLAVVMIERSLAACDRLARPTAVRRVRAFLIAERDDRLARTTVVRRMRALLVAELQRHGLDTANRVHDHAIVALLGADALTILQPNDDTPVTSAAIARCLDKVEHLANETHR